MAKQKLYSTVEIELVLRLFSELRKGKELKVTHDEHQFLREHFVPIQFLSYTGDDDQYVSYRNWAIFYNSSHFNNNGREAVRNATQPDYHLESAINKAQKYQSADILRMLRYKGQPLGMLVQCALIEMCFRLGLLPRRLSESYSDSPLQTLAEELEANGTFNI